MELEVPQYHQGQVELEAANISYTGPKELSQFEVVKTTLVNKNGKALFIMLFKRRYTYQLVSVYIPSLSLLVISLVSG